MEELLNTDFGAVAEALGDIFRDPGANIQATMLLVGLLTILVLIVLVVVVLMFSSDEDEEEYELEGRPPAREAAGVAPVQPAEEVRRDRSWPRLGVLTFWVVAVSLIWMATGYVTAQPSVCSSCHVESPHIEAGDQDPHVAVSCVLCHEPAGTPGTLTYMLPSRLVHYAAGLSELAPRLEYGTTVTSRGCQRCHGSAIADTIRIEDQGVAVSHKEPLEAGAECVDCHALNSGVVSSITVGMTPCLRCHNGTQAASECETCHFKDIGFAVRASTLVTPAGARKLIDRPDCGGCHDQAAEGCDSCHGVRMPHSNEFMVSGHARQAAEDLWFNDGGVCGRCHYDERNPCTDCHGPMPSHGGSGWAVGHRYGSPRGCTSTCHSPNSFVQGRGFCELCHEEGIEPLPQPPRNRTIGGAQ